jgi:hypothetical protein
MSDYESDDDETETRLDTDRIQEIKSLLFDIYRVNTGEDLIDVEEFLREFRECVQKAQGETFGAFLSTQHHLSD